MAEQDKDLQIAQMTGALEAYKQLHESACLQLLRRQVADLQNENCDLKAKIIQTNVDFGTLQRSHERLHEEFEAFKAEATERLDNARAYFAKQQAAKRANGENKTPSA